LGGKVAEVMVALGRPPTPWQRHVLDVALELEPVEVFDRHGVLIGTEWRLFYREVRLWVPRQSGKRRDMRVVLAGLEGEHDMPATWRCVPWKARGGYGGQRDDGTVNENRHRERLWMSPFCEGARQTTLFGGAL
jgi:hypothetical protein